MLLLISLLLSGILIPLCAEEGASARYVGGTVSAIPANSRGQIETTDQVFLGFRASRSRHHVAYAAVNLLEYGQNVNRRLALAIVISPLFVLSKTRRHYLTVGYKDGAGKQQAMVFQVDKHQIRAVLVALEARTGLMVTYQDEEARKAGKG